ncbi:MAG TPA: NUDIX domain-containing protein [Candidatus Binatia bacterium]|nr:NUDIX domain-containing protein [Candidatus Binatia bacterium]
MPRRSAGLLVYRRREGGLEVLLVHPGGPLWARRDEGAWQIPKGEYAEGEDPLAAARREFQEETGTAMTGEFMALAPIRQPGGKRVQAWAVEGDLDAAAIRSNTFTLEWPRGSGQQREFPEVDRAGWFAPAEARRKLLPSQQPLLDELLARLNDGPG